MFVLYFILWVTLNANLTLEIVLFGIVIASAVFAFTCKFMDYSLEKEKRLYKNAGKFIRYFVTLVIEVVKANYSVTRLILTEREEIQPVLVTFKEPLGSPVHKALLADAITLTPGTITVMLENDQYTVHCLDEKLAEGIEESVFTEQLLAIENGKDGKSHG